MSLMLASVNSLEEARLIRDLGVDIIDLKQPAQGALGALAVSEVAEIARDLKPGSRISATVGDLPMQPGLLKQAVETMAATGVDYVKIGFFPGGDWPGSIAALSEAAELGHDLIAVLFADARPDFSIIEDLAGAGFRGVMLDTMGKRRGSLTDLMAIDELQDFVRIGKTHSLLTGLAGSLRAEDVPGLLALNADYLGFRGALCEERRRTASLDEARIVEIRDLILKGERCKAQDEKVALPF